MTRNQRAISDGWKFSGPTRIQRQLPLTSWPMPGIRTRTRSAKLATSSHGASRFHVAIGTTSIAAPKVQPSSTEKNWRSKW